MCVEYQDLKRASPKDNFPLPHIDVLVDNTSHFALFSFKDRFSGYNQIKMALEDMEKTTFVTLWGTFCYKAMSYGLQTKRDLSSCRKHSREKHWCLPAWTMKSYLRL